jgi:hypothetical protein
MDGVEYQGIFAPPPVTSAVVIRQPRITRGDGQYAIEATFTSPSLQSAIMYMNIDLGAVPMNVTMCSSEGVSLVFITLDYITVVDVPISSSRSASAGSVPLSLPHVTVYCVLQLADEQTLYASGAPDFTVTFDNGIDDIGRARASMIPLSDAVTAVQMMLSLTHSTLSSEKLTTLLNTVSAAAIGLIPGLSPQQVYITSQNTLSSSETQIAFEFSSRGSVTVSIDSISAIAPNLVVSARSLGYTVADTTAQSFSSRFIDASCNYACGSGCRLCEDQTACSWDLDCQSGSCRDGVCFAATSSSTDLTWLWGFIPGMAALIGAVYLIYSYVQSQMKPDLQESLIMDMDEFAEEQDLGMDRRYTISVNSMPPSMYVPPS